MIGKHPAKCIGYQWGESSKGNEQIACQFRIAGEGEHANKEITWFGLFTEKTWERTQQSLRYMGWSGDDLSELGTLDDDVQIEIKEDEYLGKKQLKVAWVNRVGGGQIKLKKPLDDAAVKVFAARMKQDGRIIEDIEREPTDGLPF